jgi:hypothetical protein
MTIEELVNMPLEDIELMEEQKAESKAEAQAFCEHLMCGHGADPVFQSVKETLMPAGAVITTEEYESLPAPMRLYRGCHEKRVAHFI